MLSVMHPWRGATIAASDRNTTHGPAAEGCASFDVVRHYHGHHQQHLLAAARPILTGASKMVAIVADDASVLV